MAKRSNGFSFWGISLFLLVGCLVITGLFYAGRNLAKTHTILPASLQEAKQYCITHQGTIRESDNRYSLCVFSDKTICEVKSLFKGFCIPGIKQAITSSTQQQLCIQLGGTLVDASTNNCTFSDGSICSSAEVVDGNCHQ